VLSKTELLTAALQARGRGEWIKIDSGHIEAHIIGNFLQKLVYILTNLIGRRDYEQRLADLMPESFIELAGSTDQIGDRLF
jgi:hypothetical protein